jgi:hypothetical protein
MGCGIGKVEKVSWINESIDSKFLKEVDDNFGSSNARNLLLMISIVFDVISFFYHFI